MPGYLFRSLFEDANEAVFMLDAKTLRYIVINKEAEKLTAYSRLELAGKPLNTLTPPKDIDDYNEGIRRLNTGGSVTLDTTGLLRKDSKVLCVQVRAWKADIEDNSIILIIARDISGRMRTAAEIKQRSRELEALNDISATVNSTLELDEILESAIKRACEVTDMPVGCIFMRGDNETLTPLSCSGISRSGMMSISGIAASDCVCGRAASCREPIVVEDIASCGVPMPDAPELKTMKSMAAIPVMYRDSLLGVISLISYHERKFSAEEIRFFTSIANTIGAAINNASYATYMKTQAEKFSLLFNTTMILTSTLELKEVLQLFARNVAEASGAEDSLIFLLDSEGRLNGSASYGNNESNIAGLSFMPSGTVLETIRSNRPLFVGDAVRESGIPAEVIGIYDIKSFLSIPLSNRGKVTGAIFLFSGGKRAVFSKQAIEVAEIMAGQAAQAIENARLVDDLRRRNDELRRVYDIQRRITQSIDIEETLESVVENVPYLTRLPNCVVFLLDPAGENITSIKASRELHDQFGKLKFRMDELVASKAAISERRPIIMEDAREYQNVAKHVVRRLDMRAAIILPLIARGHVLGVMWLYDTKGPVKLDTEDIRKAVALSDQAATAIDNARLFRELTKANRQLEDSYEKLKELDDMKMEFFTLISHELRTPLTTIKGFTELLHDEVLGPLNEQQKDKLAKINASVDSLTDIVSKLSDISRIESRKYPIERIPVSLNELVQEVVRSIKFFAESKGITIDTILPRTLPIVSADRDKVEQVILNIVNNAIKYTKPGGRIIIETKDAGDSIMVSVTDTGIGIPEKDLERIFSGFYHAGYKLSYEYKGTGLGLAISKGLVESHGGRIWAESKVGKGSTFYFTLPKNT